MAPSEESFDTQSMLSVEEALQELLGALEPLPAIEVAIDDALGLVLASPVIANERHPAEDTSAMDGYAVSSEVVKDACPEHPVLCRIIEDVAAGYSPERAVGPFQCSRVSTGALIPVGANAVEMRENVRLVGDEQVEFSQPVAPNNHLRLAGEHLEIGDEVIKAGTLLSSAELGMAAYLGCDVLSCYPRLSVAILTTGSELVTDSAELTRGKVRDSNGVAIDAAVRELGCTVGLRKHVVDDAEELDRAIVAAMESSHLLLTTGGISVGWHDLVRERIEQAGGKFVFHRLRMRPGKPIAFGRIADKWIFCLPGNPVSALVTFEIFVKPAIFKLMGLSWQPDVVVARLAEPLSKKAGLTVFFRVCLQKDDKGEYIARLSGPQGSHQLKSMLGADGLLMADEDAEELKPGDMVKVRLF